MGVIYSLPLFAVALSICRSCPPTFLSKRTPSTLQVGVLFSFTKSLLSQAHQHVCAVCERVSMFVFVCKFLPV